MKELIKSLKQRWNNTSKRCGVWLFTMPSSISNWLGWTEACYKHDEAYEAKERGEYTGEGFEAENQAMYDSMQKSKNLLGRILAPAAFAAVSSAIGYYFWNN